MNASALRPTLLAAALLLVAAPSLPAQQPNPIPQHFRDIYPQASQAQSQVQQAMQLAAQQHKRVLLVFGNNQSANCQVYDVLLNSPHNHGQVAEHFLVVHINVGPRQNQNLDLAQRFNAPVKRDLPALSVIDGQGHVIHAEAVKHARNMGDPDVTEFLNKWRG